MFLHHPIRKLLIPINHTHKKQSVSCDYELTNHLIWFAFAVILLAELKKQIWHKIAESTFAYSDLFYFSSIIFKNIMVLLKRSNSSEKNDIVGEELNWIDIDDIGNLEDSPRLVLINEEYGNLILVNDGGELTENISQKRRTFYNSLWRST